MVTPEAYNVTTSPDDTTWTIDCYQNGGGLQSWGALEQDPAGEWWVTTVGDTATTTGPYLDQVQAIRALQAWDGAQ